LFALVLNEEHVGDSGAFVYGVFSFNSFLHDINFMDEIINFNLACSIPFALVFIVSLKLLSVYNFVAVAVLVF